MGPEGLIHIRDAAHGDHPEACSLNPAFRPGTQVIKLRVDIDWEPTESTAAVAALEAQLVEFCPSLQQHQCRGQEEYLILRSTRESEQQPGHAETSIEPALALAHLFEHLMIDTMAFITDESTISGVTAALKGTRTQFDIFVESPDATAARLTVEVARSWISALVAGESVNGEGRLILELTRRLYRALDGVEVGLVARRLGREPGEVRDGLQWLERLGLARPLDYPMNLSGLSYYRLYGVEHALPADH
jgi:hypothetical protein